ncbi:LTA synthase family protein [uncultured Ruminobacter sp.]|uniref:LTA synthase family protein n=1 Tax=uncultured Ruminobacter sp. TaxID=538947 RepID=UPI0025DCE943|nr:LTA synthase family protein [uncultured Ruminobacter sp.]
MNRTLPDHDPSNKKHHPISKYLFPYRHLIYFILFFIAVYALIRVAGIVIYREDINMDEVPKLLFNGLRTDLSGLGYILALPVLLTFLASSLPYGIGKIFLFAEKTYLLITGALIFFLEMCTIPFMEEYATRPNRLFLEYMIYPAELAKLLINGHLAAVITVFCLMSIFVLFFFRALKKITLKHVPFNLISVMIFVVLGTITFISARSSFEHRPFNLAKAIFSSNQIVNSLTANSGYMLATSVKSMMSEKACTYKPLTQEEIIKEIQTDTGFDYTPATSENPTLNRLIPTNTGARKNIVIILEESLGAQFVGYLGGSGLTPNLDRIYGEGYGFTNMFATGVRSVRGIEAVTSGFTPTVNTSTVKREKTQKNFFNLASVLKNEGYQNSFIYGGESHFDNMRSFFLGNGYTKIIDINNYDNPIFTGSWGVSDEDLFNKALETFDEMHRQQQPFYSLVFTSSNHDPYEIKESFSHNVRNRETAIKYADYALGKFYDEIKTKPYFNDTIFLVIADHDARAWGSELVPVNHFHIPAVLFGAGIEHKTESHVVSQIDIPKTLMSLAGIEADVPTVGYDLTQLPDGFEGRALLQFYQNFCYLKDDGSAVMILPDQKVVSAKYDFSTQTLTPTTENNSLEKKALAYAHLGELSYEHGFFLIENKQSRK